MQHSRVLLLMDHRENRRLLASELGTRYDVSVASDPTDLHNPFDLGIVDGSALSGLWTQVQARREREAPVLMPFLLLTSREDASIVTRHLWTTVDELVKLPIDRMELHARVQILLRARSLSVALQDQAAAEVSGVEAVMRQILDNSPAVIYAKDLDGHYVLVNHQYERRFGLTRDEVIGKTDFDIFPREIAQAFVDNDREVVQGGNAIEVEEAAPGTAELRTYVSVKFPLSGADGRILSVCGISTDITDRKQAEEQLAASERYLRAILDNAAAFIALLDERGVLLDVNRPALLRSGKTREDVVGRPFHETYWFSHSEKQQEIVRDAVTRALAGEMVRTEITARVGDDEAIDVDFVTAPVAESGGAQVVASGVDITDRKRVEEERRDLLNALVRAEEIERKRIATDLHDDTVQVLTSATMQMDLMAARSSDDETRARVETLAQTLRDAMGRLRQMLFDLVPPLLAESGLAAALRLTMEQLSTDAGIRYQLNHNASGEASLPVRTIAYRIAREALANVARHAEATEVVVEIAHDTERLTVQITDNGRGFDPNEPAAVGHLGLVTMIDRARRAGGDVSIQSGSRGTTVSLWLPDVGKGV